jgi:hypothetical protein
MKLNRCHQFFSNRDSVETDNEEIGGRTWIG